MTRRLYLNRDHYYLLNYPFKTHGLAYGSGLDQSVLHLPLAPLSVLGVAIQLSGPAAGLYAPGCSQMSKIGRPSETQHCPLQFHAVPLSPHYPFDMLHSCCHSALSQRQFIPSSCPYRDMHSPGRIARAAFEAL